MAKFIRLAFCLCVALTTAVASYPASAATIDQQITARLDRLERENAALRARIHRLEASKVARIDGGPARSDSHAALNAAPLPHKAEAFAVAPRRYAPRFEISGSLLYLLPSAGNLEYGTLISPLPLVSPSWENQALKPNYSPAFEVGVRYIANDFTDIALNWTHLKTTTDASVFASPIQMVGPPFLVGPESALYKEGYGTVQFTLDSVNLDAGYTFCADCAFQLRAFGGVEFARLGQDLTGTFQSPGGAASMASTTHTMFTGAGPRLGAKGQYAIGDVRFIGEIAGAALIGCYQSHMDFTTIAPGLAGPTIQSLTSPNSIRVIPSVDAKLAAAYLFPPGNYGQFKVELGYRAAIYFNAISQYSFTQVPTGLMLPPAGVYLATVDRHYSDFTNHGPYMTASWLFGGG